MALSSLSWAVLPKSIPTRGPRTPGMPAGRSPDGGRYADYRLADILSPKLLEATHCWRLDRGLEWLGQIHTRSGLAPDTVGRWTSRLGQGAGNSVHAASIHAEASATNLTTSPLPHGRLQTVTVLAPGQLALLPEVKLALPPGRRLTGRILLVRGLDARGRNGTSRCLLCSRGSCPIGSHAPMPAAGGSLLFKASDRCGTVGASSTAISTSPTA